jgi:sugar/nucleoside kinase (ribokinase family)
MGAVVTVPRYDLVVATGGLGSGMFLALEGDHTLGREESRAAALLDQRDYCKLHIVTHYLRRLLGDEVRVVPIGKVGDDPAGRDVAAQMRTAGLDLSYVTVSARPTLFSVCFLYPGGDGGNITTVGSASQDVSPEDIRQAAGVLADHRGRGIAIALPEVPLAARVALLELASEQGLLRVATFVSGEAGEALSGGLVAATDLLALNLDEAAAVAGVSPDGARIAGVSPDRAAIAGVSPDRAGIADVVEAAGGRLRTVNPGLRLVVTAGRAGSWVWDGRILGHAGALEMTVASTAGAGDAHLAGLVAATARGLPLVEANRYAAVVSGLSVASPHTIDPDLTAERVRRRLSAA